MGVGKANFGGSKVIKDSSTVVGYADENEQGWSGVSGADVKQVKIGANGTLTIYVEHRASASGSSIIIIKNGVALTSSQPSPTSYVACAVNNVSVNVGDIIAIDVYSPVNTLLLRNFKLLFTGGTAERI